MSAVMEILFRIAEWARVFLERVVRWLLRLPVYSLGFDCQYYPSNGNALLKAWRASSPLRFAGFYLTPAPSFPKNGGWMDKRTMMKDLGWGFLLLYYGRQDRALKTTNPDIVFIDSAAQGTTDASGLPVMPETAPQSAVTLARKAGFPKGAIIYLDVEQGGRLADVTLQYIANWIKALRDEGTYRPGVYCSFYETAAQIRDYVGTAELSFWIYNVRCKGLPALPASSPGCVVPKAAPAPSRSGVAEAEVWQYAKSPYEPDESSACAGYTAGLCSIAYGGESASVDLNSARSPNPSAG
jgi:hypothetical protein